MNSVHPNKSESGAILPLIIAGVLLIGILVGTNLIQVPQIFKSRAAGDDAIYRVPSDREGSYKTISQMRVELKNAGWPDQDTNRPAKELFYLYMRNGPDRTMRCAVNKGDIGNMPSQIQAINAGDRVAITVTQKWENEPSRVARDMNNHEYIDHRNWKCNEWYPNVKFTNNTTGHAFDHLCSTPNGDGPLGAVNGNQNISYEGHFNQDRPDEMNPGLYDTFAPLEQVKSCVATVSEPGDYTVEIFYADRDDAAAVSGDSWGCKTGGAVRSFCGFTTGVGQQGGITTPATPGGTNPGGTSPGGTGPSTGNYTISGHVKNSSGTAVSGVTVEVHNGLGNHVTLQTDSNGVFTTTDFIKRRVAAGQDLYSVRIPDGKGKTVGGDHTWVTTQNAHDTVSGDNSYEFQLAGANDCAGAGNNGQTGRCDFIYTGTPSSSSAPTSNTPPTATLSRADSANPVVNQTLTFTATPNITSPKTLSKASIYVARDVRSFYPVRVSSAACPGGFEQGDSKSPSYAWCKIGSTTSAGSFTGSFTPDRAATYTFMVQVEDSSFKPNEPGNQDSKYGLCASSPYVIYNFLTGYGLFNDCGQYLKVTVR